MNVYAQIDPEGFPIGFWTNDVWVNEEDGTRNSRIPEEAFEITLLQWQEFLNNPGRRKWVDGEVIVFEPPPPEQPQPVSELDELRARIEALEGKAP